MSGLSFKHRSKNSAPFSGVPRDLGAQCHPGSPAPPKKAAAPLEGVGLGWAERVCWEEGLTTTTLELVHTTPWPLLVGHGASSAPPGGVG